MDPRLTQERYLIAFHDARPGLTSAAFAEARDGQGRSGYDHLVDEVAAVAAGGPVLDLGCGDGHLMELLLRRGLDTVGVDLSPGELTAARGRGLSTLARARAQALPFADGAFAAVTSHLASMLMPEPDRVLAEVARVLRPGGVLAQVLGGGPPDDPSDGFSRVLALVRPHLSVGTPRLGDPRWRRQAELAALADGAGLRLVRFDRLALDLSGPAADVWRWLATAYGVAELEPALWAELGARFAAEVGPGRVKATMISFIAVCVRR
ncbi:MAG: class I SAM-dependent methyltransferase [Kofleriaceae bacterium]|nr:class I SAM-dependent methyltransferase [Kofleriaceae bacterium]